MIEENLIVEENLINEQKEPGALKYSYQKISSSEFFPEFMDLIKNDKLICLKTWSKKLGFANPISLKKFLTRYKIEFKLNNLLNRLGENKLMELKRDYLAGIISVEEVSVKYNMSTGSLYRLVGKEEDVDTLKRTRFDTIQKRINGNKDVSDTQYGMVVEYLNKNSIPFKIKYTKNKYVFSVMCESCGNIIERQPKDFINKKKVQKNERIICKSCYQKDFACTDASKKPLCIKKNNTGYIGVSYYTKRGKYNGYTSQLKFEKNFLFRKYFYDPGLNIKTLIEAAVYREVYIIKNNLPHTRNFEDTELFSNMQMLGQTSELEEIKNILNEQIMLKIFT